MYSRAFNIQFVFSDQTPNFVWVPFNLCEYFDAHLPFASAFEGQHGVGLDQILIVLAALYLRVVSKWTTSKGGALLRYLQRAYEGPYSRGFVFDEINAYCGLACELLNIGKNRVGKSKLRKAIRFWELDRSKQQHMDLAYPGPHYIFLPYGDDRLFIDYAWIFRRFFDLFFGVSIPDHNFKGDALEKIVRNKKTILPIQGCRSAEGGKRQVDAAFKAGNHLVIVECRAVGQSIGFHRGNPDAIRYRARIIEKALHDVDEKAQWLACHPVGENYDISHFDEILPIAVTPFVEFIPSVHPRYWLTEDLPRVLTPKEFKNALQDGTLEQVSNNLVKIHNTV
jgi:hypothetical protein